MSEADTSGGSFARAFGSLSLASGVSMAANVLRGKLAALVLGPAGVGTFNQLSLMWNLFQVAGSLGTFSGLVHHGAEAMVAKDEIALRRLSSTWWILLTSFSCLLAGAGALGSHAISDWLLSDHGAHGGLVALMLVSIPFAVSAQVYRALLAASRAVSELVRAQIFSDLGGAAVFVALIPFLGLAGAIAGFASIHLIFYVFTAFCVRKKLGGIYVVPKASEFRLSVVRGNVGFGAVGIATIILSNLSIAFVSRLVIDRFGIASTGILSNAWRIASVYLGAVTATTISYYLPTLTRSETNDHMSGEVNTTVRFYLFLMPPIMAGIMAAGEPIVWLILSRKFLPVAQLLLLFVPAELMRVLAETISVPLFARRRLKAFLVPYAIQAAIFVAGSAMALPTFGLVGAAAAYGLATTVAAIVNFAACRMYLGLRLEPRTAIVFARAAGLMMTVMAVGFVTPFGVKRLLFDTAAMLLWLLWTLLDENVKRLLSGTMPWARRTAR